MVKQPPIEAVNMQNQDLWKRRVIFGEIEKRFYL